MNVCFDDLSVIGLRHSLKAGNKKGHMLIHTRSRSGVNRCPVRGAQPVVLREAKIFQYADCPSACGGYQTPLTPHGKEGSNSALGMRDGWS